MLLDEPLFAKTNRNYLQNIVLFFAALFYTYFSPFFGKSNIEVFVTFLSFFCSLLNLHYFTSKSGENWLRSIFKTFTAPFRKIADNSSKSKNDEILTH